MRRSITFLAIALAYVACSRVDKETIREKALTALAARPPRAVPQAAPECVPGSAMKGVPHCVLPDDDRLEMRDKVRFQLRMIAGDLAVAATDNRDELAARIVHDPGFFDALVGTIALEHSCAFCNRRDPAVVALDIELTNLFANCLKLAVAAEPGNAPSAACEGLLDVPPLKDLSDDDLTDCFDNNRGLLHERRDIASFLASYHRKATVQR